MPHDYPAALNTTHSDDEDVLIAVGEIDQSNVDTFSQALISAIADDDSGGEVLTLDLSAVDYLDSAAVNVLYANADHIKIIANPRFARILTISGISELVSIDTPPTI